MKLSAVSLQLLNERRQHAFLPRWCAEQMRRDYFYTAATDGWKLSASPAGCNGVNFRDEFSKDNPDVRGHWGDRQYGQSHHRDITGERKESKGDRTIRKAERRQHDSNAV
jgi:hypothetical protein